MGLSRTITGNDRSNKHGCNEVSETHCETFISFFSQADVDYFKCRHIEKYFIEIGRFRNRDKKKIKRRLDKPRKMQRGKTIRADVGRQLDIERKVQR